MLKKLFLFVSVFSFFSITAFAESIDRFDVDVSLKSDSTMTIVESIYYDFGDIGEHHGIIRDIPLLYGESPNQVAIDIDVEKIVDENGNLYEYSESFDNSSLQLKIGSADILVSGKQVYKIYYQTVGLVNNFDDVDELYWNATGNFWNVPIKEANVTLATPVGGEPSLSSATCHTGSFGATYQNCTYSIEENIYSYQAENLGISEGLTIVAAFDADLVLSPALVTIDPQPWHTTVYKDGYGLNSYVWPTTLRIPPGEVELVFEAAGHKKVVETLNLNEGEIVFLSPVLQETALWIFLSDYLPALASALGIFLILWLWTRKGRDPRGRGVIMPFYKPMKGMTPGDMGVLVDEVAHLHDITGTIIHLAVMGYMKIRKGKGKRDYTFVKLKDPGKDLKNFEKEIFEAIFEGDAKEVEISDLKNNFYQKLPALKKSLYDEALANGYFPKSPDKVRNYYLVWGVILLVFSVLFGLVLAILLESLIALISIPLPGVVLTAIAHAMPVKTQKGVEEYEKILGYKEFLDTAEKDRIKVLFSPKEYADVFEKNLPYAMVLGVEKSWAKQFEGLYEGIPSWFEGPGISSWTLHNFVYHMGSFTSYADSVYTSAPSSNSWGGGSYGGSSSGGWSGGSGFGGGFSGGGFGGGGGSSW